MATSISDVVAQNTVGFSEGYPVGVPSSYAWYGGVYKPAGGTGSPAGFTSVTGWGQVYQMAGAPAYSNPNATVEVANARTYVRIRATGEWVLVQNQSSTKIEGGHFVSDFSGNAGSAMQVTTLSGGNAVFRTPPSGYNDHFWLGARGSYPAGAVDAVYVQMDMRVSDPNMKLVANVGADWWRTPNAPYLDGFSNNPTAGVSNWVQLSTEWTTLGFYSLSTAEFQADLPPPLLGSTDTTPRVISFSPDSGTVGDGITNATVLTLAGTAQAGSTVSVFDGSTLLGTARASSTGTWTFQTGQMSNATHNFTVTAQDASGNVSARSNQLNVTVATDPTNTLPRVLAFSPDSGTVGDGITNASVLTLTGTAQAGSTVNVFNGTTQIGTTQASSSGVWSFQTGQLSTATHRFTVTARNSAGNVSAPSSPLNVTVTAPPAVGTNLLTNGSFEQVGLGSVAEGNWGAYSSIPGWTALSNSSIELWNNVNGVRATNGNNFGELDYLGARDGFYQTVGTGAGQVYELTFDARSRPGFTSTTSSIEVLWNDSVIATVPPDSDWTTYRFEVVGTGGQDRLTFREAANQGGDGLGALYDNVSLIARGLPNPLPRIISFSPDSGTVGDGITNASVLTLAGTAQAGSTVSVFNGSTLLGTAQANSTGTWSFLTGQLPNATHNFTVTARVGSGAASAPSSPLNVTVAAPQNPVGGNLLVNGSFEDDSPGAVLDGRWAAFSTIPGWTALTNSSIELWNNLNGVRATDGTNYGELDYLGGRDGLYQTVRTTAGQSYDLSFDARSRPGSTSATTTIEVLWNDTVVATVPPGNSWSTYHFEVTGTGGQDRLTFREAANQAADGLGALYDNVSLVATQSASSARSAGVAEMDLAMNLVTQYAAASFDSTSVVGGLDKPDLSASLAQTLAQPHQTV